MGKGKIITTVLQYLPPILSLRWPTKDIIVDGIFEYELIPEGKYDEMAMEAEKFYSDLGSGKYFSWYPNVMV